MRMTRTPCDEGSRAVRGVRSPRLPRAFARRWWPGYPIRGCRTIKSRWKRRQRKPSPAIATSEGRPAPFAVMRLGHIGGVGHGHRRTDALPRTRAQQNTACSAMLCNTIQNQALTVQHSAVQCSARHCNAMPDNMNASLTTPYDVTHHNNTGGRRFHNSWEPQNRRCFFPLTAFVRATGVVLRDLRFADSALLQI